VAQGEDDPPAGRQRRGVQAGHGGRDSDRRQLARHQGGGAPGIQGHRRRRRERPRRQARPRSGAHPPAGGAQGLKYVS